MDPVEEHRLRRWIENVLAMEGHTLRKTRQDDPQFKLLGRWSRWGYNKKRHTTELIEDHVNLEDLATRCAVYLKINDRKLYR